MSNSGKWALLIGIDKYHESLGSLKYAGADCRVIRDSLIEGSLGFPKDQVLLLSDDQDYEQRPTFANIHSYLGSWLAAPKEEDMVFVYFAGHGRLVNGRTYLVPGDATLSSLHTLGIPLKHIQDMLEQCHAKRKILVLDACHSGAGRDVGVMTTLMQDEISNNTGFYTIASCGADELSHEWEEKRHGVFSHFLSEALNGRVSPGIDGRLTVDSIYEWVHDNVVKWAMQHRCTQTPQRYSEGAGTIVLNSATPDFERLYKQHLTEVELLKLRIAEAEAKARASEAELKIKIAAMENQIRSAENDKKKMENEMSDRMILIPEVCKQAYMKSVGNRQVLFALGKDNIEREILDFTAHSIAYPKRILVSPDGKRILLEDKGDLYVLFASGDVLSQLTGQVVCNKRAQSFSGSTWSGASKISSKMTYDYYGVDCSIHVYMELDQGNCVSESWEN